MLNYTLAAAVIFICVGYVHSSTLPAIVCVEPNTEYSSCKNNCTDKCPTVPPGACPRICYEGCFCKQDYSRALNGTCVLTENCPVQCPDNEVFGKRCTDTCDEDRIRCRESFYGCFCKPGLKRIEGKCVPEGKCFNCSQNEVYNECSNLCRDSCPGPTALICPDLCIKGCSCQSNYKRDSQTNECIPSEKCNDICPENSIYGCFCDDSCRKNEMTCVRCVHRCGCKTGFTSINGTCQPDSLC